MLHGLYVDVLCWTVNVTHFYYYVYHVIGIIHLRRNETCGSIVTEVRLRGEAGTKEIELEGITKGRYILNFTTAKMKMAVIQVAAEGNSGIPKI